MRLLYGSWGMVKRSHSKIPQRMKTYRHFLNLHVNLAVQWVFFLAHITTIISTSLLLIYALFLEPVLLLVIPYFLLCFIWLYYHPGDTLRRLAGFVSLVTGLLLYLEEKRILISEGDFFSGILEFTGLLFLMMIPFALYIVARGIGDYIVIHSLKGRKLVHFQIILLVFVIPAFFALNYTAVNPDLNPNGHLGRIMALILISINLGRNLVKNLSNGRL